MCFIKNLNIIYKSLLLYWIEEKFVGFYEENIKFVVDKNEKSWNKKEISWKKI